MFNTASGLLIAAVTGGVGYWFGQKNLSSEVAEGLSLLDLDTTSESLATLVSSFDRPLSLVSQRKPHPAKSSVAQLNGTLDKLSKAIDDVKTSEYYSVEELKKLANEGGYSVEFLPFGSASKYEKFVQANIGKPKRMVEGLVELKPRLELVREAASSIAGQLDQESDIDANALESLLAEMKREASNTLAALRWRQSATLATLKKFGKARWLCTKTPVWR